MGSPKPSYKAPPAPVYYMPPPIDTGPSEEEKAEAVQKEREQNLLRRGRGTLGTVLSGFRGLLATSDQSNQRKSLLGE